VDAGQTVVELFKRVSNHTEPIARRKRLVVVKDGKAIGVIDRAQVFEATSHPETNRTAGDVCSKDFLMMNQDEYAYQALRLMSLHDQSFVVIIDNGGNLVGYVSRGDVTRALKRKIEDETLVEKA